MAEPASTRRTATSPATGEARCATARSAAIQRTADCRGTGKSGLAELRRWGAEALERDRDNASNL